MKRTSLLFRKYVRILVIWMGGLSCLVGIVHMVLVADVQRQGVAHLLDAEGRIASGQIRGFLDNTVASLKWIDDIDQPGTALDYEAMKDAGYRILRRDPSIIGFAYFDGVGCERLTLSRLQPDSVMDCRSAPVKDPRAKLFESARTAGTVYGDVFFPDGSEPHFYIGIASRGANTGALVAEINLKVIHDSVSAIKVGNSGLGFIVDMNNRLIAHPDETLVLRQTRLPADFPRGGTDAGLSFADDFTGQPVVTASQWIVRPAWRVVVEEPVREALAPVYGALVTTGALVLATVLGSLFAGMIVADRLARPLSQLRDGAARIAQGDLTTRLDVKTGDEIEQVADEFNRMAGALDDSLAHLEAKVADRTAALQETTQMVQRQASELSELNTALSESLDDAQRRKDDAERANAAKTRFLAVASHDLRQPMHAVSLLVGLLSAKIHFPEVRKIVEKIQGSVEAMEELFNSLLDISKLDAGAVQPTQEDFALASLFERVARSFEPLAEQKGLALCVEPSLAIVHSDPVLLERIVFNLVSNAIRYTAAGSVSVQAGRAGELLSITVEDTGIGIPAEYRERIFDEFFQIANTSRDRSKGLGLGLSIVKRCADLLGHRLSLTSGPQGSQFRIDVPCVGANADTQSAAAVAQEASPRLASAFVLVIDDDADNRFAAEESYRQWGCRVLAADSVDAAIEALSEHLRTPDLIVSDFHLTDTWTGVRGVAALRAHLECWIPAIILTGETAALKSLHLDHSFIVLQKPAGSTRLREASERLLSLDLPEALLVIPASSET